MEARVSEVIRNASASDGSGTSGTTYAILYGARSKFEVSSGKLAEFLDNICALASKDESSEESTTDPRVLGLPIAEVNTQRTLPYITTMLFRFQLSEESKEDPHLYSDSFILMVTHLLQNLMIQRLQLSALASELFCVVLESCPWQQGLYTMVRVRFHFPYAQIDVGFQRRTLRPLLIQLLRQAKVISKLEVQPIGDWDSILEEIKDTVSMYRSKEDLGSAPMSFTHLYGLVSEDMIDSPNPGAETELNLMVFRPAHHQYFISELIQGTILAKAVPLKYWLPLFLSIRFWGGMVNPKDVDVTSDLASRGSDTLQYDEKVNDRDPQFLLQQLLPLLSAERFNTEPYWLDVGRVIHNIYRGNDEGLNLWIQNSARATVPERDKDACLVRYSTLHGSPLTEKTIAWYAREDSPSGYADWHRAWCENSLNEALSTTEDDVAEALYRQMWLEYMCTGSGKNCWVRFVGTYLKVLDDAIQFRREITDRFIPIFKQRRVDFALQSMKVDSKAVEKARVEIQLKQLGTLITRLGRQSFKTTLVKAAAEKFYVDDFIKVRDADPNKTSWKNCVVECCGDEAYVRNGKPEDFLTLCTFSPYRFDMHWKHPLVVELMRWLGQVFTDKDLCHYFLKDAASMLVGRNAEKLFRVWSGDGDNSKSMLVKLLQAFWGPLCIDFPVSMITVKAIVSSSGPTPELAQARGAHVGIICEPDSREKIQAGKIKRWTGNDRFFGRGCNENGGSIEVFFKLILMCNRIPDFSSMEKAMKNRFLYLPFLSTWVMTGAPEDEEEQKKRRLFPMDPFFERRIPELAQAFGWVIVQYYQIYKKEGLIAPDIVKEYTQRHWEEHDPMLNFIIENIQRAYVGDPSLGQVDEKASLTASDIYPVFKSWYSDNYPKSPILSQAEFRDEMTVQNRLGPQYKKRWHGIRIQIPISHLLEGVTR